MAEDEKLVEAMAQGMAIAVTGHPHQQTLREMDRAALAAARKAGWEFIHVGDDA